MRRLSASLAISLSALVMVSASLGQQTSTTSVPNLIRYGGTLKDAQGAPLASSTVGVTFAIYQQQDGGAAVWVETQNVTSDAAGDYSVVLGSTTATGLPGDLFSRQEQRWLGVQIQGQAEQPRVLMVSVPYAFKAHEAETLGGKSVSDFVLANGATPAANSGSNVPVAVPITNNAPAPNGPRKGAASDGPTNFSGSTTDQIVSVTQSGTGVGVKASAPTLGIIGTATAPSGTTYGVQGIATGMAGVGLIGTASSTTGFTYGLRGTSSSTSGTGVRGISVATSGSTTGISGYVDSAAGTAAVLNNAAGGKILSGQNNGAEAFAVDGSGNVNSTSGTYRIGGSNVLNIGSPADGNLFLGVGAGAKNVNGDGAFNTYSGYEAGYNNAVGQGNTFIGYEAGFKDDGAGSNTFVGSGSGYSTTTGESNTFVGASSGYSNTMGESNTFSGGEAGNNNTVGNANTFTGVSAGFGNTNGNNNTFSGVAAGIGNTTGSYNNFYGYQAGDNNTSGSSDVYIANEGPILNEGESNTIRIGTQGAGNGEQNTAYFAGIYGSTVDHNGIPVYVDDNGQLGTVVSSLRFKEQVRDMGDSTDALIKLRPVTFLYRPEYSKGERTLQYGLIAEEVAKVYPELVAYDNDGQPYSVRYQYLSTMLLNEVQKQYRRAEAEAEQIKTQQQEIESLRQQVQLQNATLQERLSQLETLVRNQTQTVAEK